LKKLLLGLLLLIPMGAWAQVKVNALPSGTTPSGADYTICDQSGVTNKCTMSQLETYIASALSNIPLTALAPLAPGTVLSGPLSGSSSASPTAIINPLGCVSTSVLVNTAQFNPYCYSSTGSGNTLVSQLDAAFNAAVAYTVANSASATVVIPPGAWNLCNAQQGWVIPQQYGVNLQGYANLGSSINVSCVINRSALPSGAQTGQGIKQSAIWMPVPTTPVYTQLHWKDFSLYGASNATTDIDLEGLMFLLDFENITAVGASGDGTANSTEFRLGNSSYLSQSTVINSVFRHISTNVQGSQGSGAVITVSVSGGTPTFTVSNGGSGYSANTVVTVAGPPNASFKPCFGYSGASPTINLTPTISGGVITAVSGAGLSCNSPLYANAYDPGQAIQFGMWLDHTTDNEFYDLEPQIGASAAMYVGSASNGNRFYSTHPCCGMAVGLYDHANNQWFATEFDTLSLYGAFLTASSQFVASSFYWPSSGTAGAGGYFVSPSTTPSFIGDICTASQTNGGYYQFSSSTGAGTYPTGISVTNAQECLSNTFTNSYTNNFYQIALKNGALFNDTGDDGPGLNVAFATCTISSRCRVDVPSGLTSKINTELQPVSGVNALNLNGLTLDASGMSSGQTCAVNVQSASGTSGGYYSNDFAPSMPIENFRLLGPNWPTNNNSTLNGICTAGATNAVSTQTFRNISVEGFYDGLWFGSNEYVNFFYGVNVQHNIHAGRHFVGTTGALENTSFFGGNVSNNNLGTVSVTGTATGGSTTTIVDSTQAWTTNQWQWQTACNTTLASAVASQCSVIVSNTATTLTFYATQGFAATVSGNGYTITKIAYGTMMDATETAAKDIKDYGVSQDFNDAVLLNLGGEKDDYGSHFEDSHNKNTMFVVQQPSSSFNTGFLISGGNVVSRDTGPRGTYVMVDAGFPKSYAKFSGTRFSISNNAPVCVFCSTNGQWPNVSLENSNADYFGNLADGSTTDNWPALGLYLNALSNYTFATGDTTGWAASGTGWTWTAGTIASESGVGWPLSATTDYIQGVSTGSGAGAILQNIPCTPGTELISRLWIYTPTFTSGHINLTVSFFDSSGLINVATTSNAVITLTTSNAPTAAPAVYHFNGPLIVPPTAAQCQLNIGGPSGGNVFTGTVQIAVPEMRAL
jgi:hypothetical protein